MIKYHILFEVKFFHGYYDSYTSKDFEIIPTRETATTMTSFSLIYKETSDGFVVLYKEEKKHLLEKLNEEINMNFGIHAKNRYFESFSKLIPLNASNKYYFTNKGNVSTEDNEENQSLSQIMLHSDGFVGKNNVCLYCYDNSLLSELFSGEELIFVKDGTTEYDGKPERWTKIVEILGDTYGCYEVKLKSTNETHQLLYLQNSLSKAFGVIDIVVGGENVDFSTVTGSQYHIRFENRSVLWKYYFISNASKSFDLIDLYLGKEKLPFSEPELVTLANGRQAMKVTSLDEMPLKKEYPKQQLYADLGEQSSDVTHGRLKKKINLPTPDVTRIKGIKRNNIDTYYSEMYVYI